MLHANQHIIAPFNVRSSCRFDAIHLTMVDISFESKTDTHNVMMQCCINFIIKTAPVVICEHNV